MGERDTRIDEALTWLAEQVGGHAGAQRVRSILNPEEEEAGEDAPSANASTDEWYEYREAQGYTEEELDGLGRNELRKLPDKGGA